MPGPEPAQAGDRESRRAQALGSVPRGRQDRHGGGTNENGIPIGTCGDEGMVRTNFGDWIDRAHAVAFQPDGKLVVAG